MRAMSESCRMGSHSCACEKARTSQIFHQCFGCSASETAGPHLIVLRNADVACRFPFGLRVSLKDQASMRVFFNMNDLSKLEPLESTNEQPSFPS